MKKPIRFNTYCEQYVNEIPSRKGVKKAIKQGAILLNGKLSEGGRWLKKGDTIILIDLNPKPPKAYPLDLPVLYEDETIAVVHKPAGISVSGNQYRTVQNALGHNLKQSTQEDALNWPLPVHRLDNPTSGLLLIAKTRKARIVLGQAFEQKTIAKTYRAVIIGKTAPKGEINQCIDGKPAHSSFRTLQTVPSLKNDFLSLVELTPHTGRTHQLRIHCANIGAPILGDKTYGKEGLILKHKGLFLCAVGLQFEHPITHKLIVISIPTPAKFLKRLENEKKRYVNYKSSNIAL